MNTSRPSFSSPRVPDPTRRKVVYVAKPWEKEEPRPRVESHRPSRSDLKKNNSSVRQILPVLTVSKTRTTSFRWSTIALCLGAVLFSSTYLWSRAEKPIEAYPMGDDALVGMPETEAPGATIALPGMEEAPTSAASTQIVTPERNAASSFPDQLPAASDYQVTDTLPFQLENAPAEPHPTEPLPPKVRVKIPKKNLVKNSADTSVSVPAAVVKPKTHYKVWIWQERGDCLWRIAERVYKDKHKWNLIYLANRDVLRSPHKIFPKQVLKIPDVNWQP